MVYSNELEKATTLQSLGIISTDQGLQYHPESIPKRKPRKSRSSKPSESSPKKVKKTQKDTSRAAKQKELVWSMVWWDDLFCRKKLEQH